MMHGFARADEAELTALKRERYLRQLSLAEIGEDGQRRLSKASVLCIGVGGLGCPSVSYLAAAGVGKIGLVDPDLVGRSNLHRQLLFSDSDIDAAKVDAAKKRLREINPHCSVVSYHAPFTKSNALEIATGYDLIVDGTDNFGSRYLSNDTAVQLGVPNVYASIYRFEGQLSVFDPATAGGCYRCMFPVPPADGLVPDCAEGGVLGVLPGIVGTMQAAEALKVLLGIGTPLRGHLLHIDTLHMNFRRIALRKDPSCPACGTRKLEIETTTYGTESSYSCDVPGASGAGFSSISPGELALRMSGNPELRLIDVREVGESVNSPIPTAEPIPLSELAKRAPGQLSVDDEIVVYCSSSDRSRMAAGILAASGYSNVAELRGGIFAWASHEDK